MKGALVILVAMIVIGVVLFITDVIFYRRNRNNTHESEENPDPNTTGSKAPFASPHHGDLCCGQHLVCEKMSLSPLSDEIIYYDDEELDRFKGRAADSYSSEEEEQFRDVLLTLLPQDVPGWARSMSLRQINLPLNVREELLMIVNELRGSA